MRDLLVHGGGDWCMGEFRGAIKNGKVSTRDLIDQRLK